MRAHEPIGILGGTFDPIHNAHIYLARECLEQLPLQSIRFIPCGQPPHREPTQATAQQRLQMLQMALQDISQMLVDDREIKREGPSYMVDTLLSLKKDYPDNPLCLILGFDAFLGLTTWHAWEQLLVLAHLVVVNRPESEHPLPEPLVKLLDEHQLQTPQALQTQSQGGIYPLHIPPLTLSATEIRQLIHQGEDASHMLPATAWPLAQDIYAPQDS